MDFERMTRPLAGSFGPCGEDMAFSTEFDAIQEARRFDDPTLAQGEWVTDVKEADWGKVVQICEELLGQRTKDIRLAVWLAEALAKKQGLSGLADGYDLLCGLCESLWPDLHPQADEDSDMEARIGSLDWLAGQSTRLIREIPLTRSAAGAFSLQDLDSARAAALKMEQNPDQAEEIARDARVTMKQFEAAQNDTSGDYFVSGMDHAERVKVSVKALKEVLDGFLGNDSPVFGNVFDALVEIHSAFHRYAVLAGALAENGGNVGPADGTPADVAAERREALVTGEPVPNREQALRQLNEIAAFFKRTEPHSPVAYLAEKAAKWGNMPLHVWLRSVVKDDSALQRMEELLGVDASGGPEGGSA